MTTIAGSPANLNSSPKISGKFNNCAFHCLVPALLNIVGYLAEVIPTPSVETSARIVQLRDNYEHFRGLFAEYYGLDADNFTWQKFYTLLTAGLKNDRTLQQLVLGVVLREWAIVNSMPAATITANTLLTAKELFDAVAGRLGISITDATYRSANAVEPFKADSEIAKLEIYNNGHGHFELNPPGNIPSAVDEYEILREKCNMPEESAHAVAASDYRKGSSALKTAVQKLVTPEVSKAEKFKQEIIGSYNQLQQRLAAKPAEMPSAAVNGKNDKQAQIAADERLAIKLQLEEIEKANLHP